MPRDKDELITSNQTTFGQEEPLFESPPQVVDPDAPLAVRKTWWKSPIVWVIAAGVVVLALILVMAMVARPRPAVLEPLPTPEPSLNPKLTPLQQRVSDLRLEVQQADPTQQEIPFPPVRMELPLDPPRAGQ